ncbi:MAG: hypothetical protein M1833_003117, partial [Piccolia ochrophora]
MTSPSPTPLKVLMLHGYTQSGPLFHSKTRALEKSLTRHLRTHPSLPTSLRARPLELLYPTAPHRVVAPSPSPFPGSSSSTTSAFSAPSSGPTPDTTNEEAGDTYAWWRKDESTGQYTGLEAGLAAVADVLAREGPVVGVVGFSQGAALAAMVASLLEPGRSEAFGSPPSSAASPGESGAGEGIRFPSSFLPLTTAATEEAVPVHPPLLFALCYAGFRAPAPRYDAFYAPRIATPVLNVWGTLDAVVGEERWEGLVGACE